MPDIATDPLAPDDLARSQTDAPRELELQLRVRDPEVIGELWRRATPEAREHHALAALRLGVLALRQASGMIDTAAIRQAGSDMLENLRGVLNAHAQVVTAGISGDLKTYFDPNTGHFPGRLDRLIKKDGDLDKYLRSHLDGDTSTVALTLAKQVGQSSPLYKLLSPTEKDGLVSSLQVTIQQALDKQREVVLAEFSLNSEESALSRLVKKIATTNDGFSDKLTKDINKVSLEFDLNNKDGALRRLVGRVEEAQETITKEFSLNNEGSALSRLKKVVEELGAKNEQFQQEVRRTLEVIQAKKAEADRGTQGGNSFEDNVCAWVQSECGRLEDTFEPVGTTVGTIKSCKVGDGVIVLGPECAGAGARVVVEAKQRDGYTLASAMEELKTAKKNREAGNGMFVFSRKTAPSGLESLHRHGSDVYLIWDDADRSTDVFLQAGLGIARALALRECAADQEQAEDFDAVEAAVEAVEGAVKQLDGVKTMATTIESHGGKIKLIAEKALKELPPQIEALNDHLKRLRG